MCLGQAGASPQPTASECKLGKPQGTVLRRFARAQDTASSFNNCPGGVCSLYRIGAIDAVEPDTNELTVERPDFQI